MEGDSEEMIIIFKCQAVAQAQAEPRLCMYLAQGSGSTFPQARALESQAQAMVIGLGTAYARILLFSTYYFGIY